ncbi:UNC5C-like protein isoform X2 [Ptychodera flava]
MADAVNASPEDQDEDQRANLECAEFKQYSLETFDSGICSLSPCEDSCSGGDDCYSSSQENLVESQVDNQSDTGTSFMLRETSIDGPQQSNDDKRKQSRLDNAPHQKKLKCKDAHLFHSNDDNATFYPSPVAEAPSMPSSSHLPLQTEGNKDVLKNMVQSADCINETCMQTLGKDGSIVGGHVSSDLWTENSSQEEKTSEQGASELDYVPTETFPMKLQDVLPIPDFPNFHPAPGDYKAARFDHNGGCLKLPERGVKLLIPPYAIEQGQTQVVYVYFSKERSHVLPAKNREVPLTPTIFCGPHGVKFKKQVLLTLPHCAANARKNWKFTTYSTDTKINEAAKFEADKSVLQIVTKDSVTVFTDHFTGFGCSGSDQQSHDPEEEMVLGKENIPDDLGKHVTIVPYFQRKGKDVIIRVHACYSFQLKDVYEDEDKMGGKQSDVPRQLELVDGEGDLVISVKDLDVGVNQGMNQALTNSEDTVVKCISFRNLWHGFRQSLTFVVQAIPNGQFRCSVLAQQKFNVKFQITEFISPVSVPCRRNYKSDDNPTSLPYSLVRDLSLELDVPSEFGCDWRGFANEIGLSANEIMGLQASTGRERSSPTEKLMFFWRQQQEQIGEAEIRSLYDIFRKIRNNSAAGEVKRAYPNFSFPVHTDEK